jgi:apoptosis-inducing factor 2
MQKIIIVGGGYCGLEAFLALKSKYNVTVIEPNEHFFHHIGSIRGMVDSDYNHSLYFPYSNLLGPNWIKDRVIKVNRNSVVTGNGEEIAFDFLILATGSTYTTPLINGILRTENYFDEMAIKINKANTIKLNGAGPVGIELAGEIKDVYPDKDIILTHKYDLPLTDKFDERLRQSLKEILIKNKVKFVNNNLNKQEIESDLEIDCYGSKANTSFLIDSGFENSNGHILTNQYLQIPNNPNIFVVGDIINQPCSKTYINGKAQVDLVANNISKIINNQPLKQYTPNKYDLISVPFGRKQGSAYLPFLGGIIVPGFLVSKIKGKDLFRSKFAKWFE